MSNQKMDTQHSCKCVKSFRHVRKKIMQDVYGKFKEQHTCILHTCKSLSLTKRCRNGNLVKSVTHQYKHFKTAQLYFEEMIAGSVDLKAVMAVHSVKNSIGDH